MSQILVRCQCGAKLQLGIKVAGKVCRCPKCQSKFTAPDSRTFGISGGQVLSLTSTIATGKQETPVHPASPPSLPTPEDDASPVTEVVHEGLAAAFDALKTAIESCADHEHLDSTLSDWLEPDDDDIPYKFLTWRIRRILNTPFRIFSSSWITEDRLATFVELLGRVHQTACSSTGVSDESATSGDHRPVNSDSTERHLTVSGTAWRTWCEVIECHDLSATSLGALAGSLEDLPGSFWDRKLREFTSKTYLELSGTPGLGPRKMSVVVDLFRELASQLASVPAKSSLGVILLPKPIRELSFWLYQVLEERHIPTSSEIATSFCRPLLTQLQTDLSPEVASIVIRRLGVDGKPETLAEIADDVGLTRERVRQLTLRATKVLHVRWPQGKHLLDDLYELLRSAPNAQEQVILVRTILDRCFDLDFAVGGSRDEVIDAFRAAAKKRQTPMAEDEVVAWVATRFRRITPELAFSWIATDAMTWTDSNGQLYYFSDDPWDTLLLMLLTQDEPLSLIEAAQLLETDERSVAGRVSRDPRFIEIDEKKVQAAHLCGVNRVDGEWRISLVAPASNSSPSVVSISVDSLIEIVVAGLLQADIADATVWGVHRYANQMLESVYNGRLPAELTPFALQEVLASHSDGIIRRMRRRRLRWDANHTIPARGKIGWVGYVSLRAGIPMTIAELQKELRKFYQDYEPYVLQQLNLDEEDGDASLGVSTFGGIPHRVPPLIIPDDWQLDCNSENVSEQLKLVASKIVDIGRRRGFPKGEFDELPWMVSLVDHYAFGKMNWSDDPNATQSAPRHTPAADDLSVLQDDSVVDVPAGGPSTDVRSKSGSSLESIIEQLDGLL